jgi:hypothetical protein
VKVSVLPAESQVLAKVFVFVVDPIRFWLNVALCMRSNSSTASSFTSPPEGSETFVSMPVDEFVKLL